MRSRYYSPAIGRFISRDPAGLAGGINLYAYAGDSPTNFTDPTGLGLDSLEGPGDVCCYSGVGVPTSFQFGFGGSLPRIANQGGLDVFYVGQNGGGLASADLLLVVFRAPIPYVPEDESNSSSPGQGWVPKGKGYWNQENQQRLRPNFNHGPPKGGHWDWYQRNPSGKRSLRRLGDILQFWEPDIQEWLPVELLPLEFLP
jgi:uncharacterized protein RhaS with RHS repeats